MEVPTTDSALVADQDLDTRLPTTPNLSLILERKEIREHTPKKKKKKKKKVYVEIFHKMSLFSSLETQ